VGRPDFELTSLLSSIVQKRLRAACQVNMIEFCETSVAFSTLALDLLFIKEVSRL